VLVRDASRPVNLSQARLTCQRNRGRRTSRPARWTDASARWESRCLCQVCPRLPHQGQPSETPRVERAAQGTQQRPRLRLEEHRPGGHDVTARRI